MRSQTLGLLNGHGSGRYVMHRRRLQSAPSDLMTQSMRRRARAISTNVLFARKYLRQSRSLATMKISKIIIITLIIPVFIKNTNDNGNSFITESKKHIQAVEQLRRELQAEESLFAEASSSTIPPHANEEGVEGEEGKEGKEKEEKQGVVDGEEEVNEADAIQVEQVLRNDRLSKKKQKKQKQKQQKQRQQMEMTIGSPEGGEEEMQGENGEEGEEGDEEEMSVLEMIEKMNAQNMRGRKAKNMNDDEMERPKKNAKRKKGKK